MTFISRDVTHSIDDKKTDNIVWASDYYVTREIINFNGLKTSYNKQHVFYVSDTEERSLKEKLIAYNYMPENIMRFNSDESCFQNQT